MAVLLSRVGSHSYFKGGDKENGLLFSCNLAGGKEISFHVPYDEGKDFKTITPAQLLIRWMV